ncbi:hypothetical protein SLA2020_447450 [Shorea laevis]
MKPKCLWTKNKKKRQAQAKEKQQQLKMVKELTLEECLSASPGYAYEQFFDRIYPAFSGEDHEDYSFSRDSMERLLKVEEIDRREMGVSSLSRSQSGKVKKSVRFRLPEEADIIRFYSPEESILKS